MVLFHNSTTLYLCITNLVGETRGCCEDDKVCNSPLYSHVIQDDFVFCKYYTMHFFIVGNSFGDLFQ